MNTAQTALEVANNAEHLSIIGFLVLAVLFLGFQLRDKKRVEALVERLVISNEQMVEINKKYQTYYEKMIEENLKKETRTGEIYSEILKELRQGRQR